MKKKDKLPNIKAKEPVRIRYKKLTNGNLSIYLDIYQNGKRIYEFLKLYLIPEKTEIAKLQNQKTQQLADSIKAKRILQINTTTHGLSNQKENSKIPLRDYIQSFADTKNKSIKQNLYSLIYHLTRFRKIDIPIGLVDKHYIMEFIEYLSDAEIEHTERNKGRKLSKNTQAMYFKCLRMALDEAVSNDIIGLNPVLSIKKKDRPSAEINYDRIFLEPSELERFAQTNYPNELLKRAFMIGCLTGLRHCDIKQLKWGNIIIKNNKEYIRVRQQKTKRYVEIPINNKIKKWLPKRENATADDIIFTGLLSLGRSNEILPKWAKMAGIDKHVTFHVSRHTFAVLAIHKKTDIYTTSKLLGHKDIKTTQIYTEVLDRAKITAMNRMEKIKV